MKNKTKKLTSAEVSMFCRQLDMVLRSGIPLYDGIGTLAENYKGTEYSWIFAMTFRVVESGGMLKIGLEQTGVFPTYMIKMVEMGEITGNLEKVLQDLTVYYDREDKFKSLIKGAITYPIILAIMMGVVVGVLVVVVMPIFTRVFESLGADSNEYTEFALDLGSKLGYIILVAIGVLLIVALVLYIMWKVGKGGSILYLASRMIKPIKELLSAQTAQRFSAVMYMSIDSGYGVMDALNFISGMIHNSKEELKVLKCTEWVRKTGDVTMAIEKSGIYDTLHAKMIQTGGRSGKLDEVLKHMASLYNTRIEDEIHKITGWVEPALVLALALLIGGMLLSVMLPLLSIMSTIM